MIAWKIHGVGAIISGMGTMFAMVSTSDFALAGTGLTTMGLAGLAIYGMYRQKKTDADVIEAKAFEALWKTKCEKALADLLESQERASQWENLYKAVRRPPSIPGQETSGGSDMPKLAQQ
jgi:hypothetical protein